MKGPPAADLALDVADDEPPAVLLIAGDGPAGAILQRSLEQAGLSATRATRLVDLPALTERGAAFSPRVVLLDLDLTGDPEELGLDAIRTAFPAAVIVALANELEGERAARLLGSGVASLSLPVSSEALAAVVRRFAGAATDDLVAARSGVMPAPGAADHLESFLGSYARQRALSERQRTILTAYLAGSNDKEIASDSGCSEATVYEHWRRMARKVGGLHKSDVIADFHRFLRGE